MRIKTRVPAILTLLLAAAVCMSGVVLFGCSSHKDSGPEVMTKKFPGGGAANGSTTPASPASK